MPLHLNAECDKQGALIAELSTKVVNPQSIKQIRYFWTSDLKTPAKAKAIDRHLFAVADRFGGSHELMNSLDKSVELEYYFQKSNGVMRRGFAMAIVDNGCAATLTYIGTRPYQFKG